MKRLFLSAILISVFTLLTAAQAEILTNAEIIEMSRAGIGKDLIMQKIKITANSYDTSAKGLVELKKANVEDDVIALLVVTAKAQADKSPDGRLAPRPEVEKNPLTAADALRSARTLAIHKDSLNPSRQALEKELIKRPEWKNINLTITEDKQNADLSIQIGFVPLSLITHRYVFRVYDRRSGILIAAGETTSWGSLAENLARNIARSLSKALAPN